MSFMYHIQCCNAHDLAEFRPLIIAGREMGRVRHALAERLSGIDPGFVTSTNRVVVDPAITGFEALTALFDRLAAYLAKEVGSTLHGEKMPAIRHWGETPLFAIERWLLPFVGVRRWAVHVNGFVRQSDGRLAMWVGRRAANRENSPGKLDNMIAGGQPMDLSLMANLIKEAAEEASVPESLARESRPVGCLSYRMATAKGMRDDVLFCYDLEVSADFRPVSADGENAEFHLITLDEVADIIRDSDNFKFNCALVIIDFLIRHGYLDPDHQPDYQALVNGLHHS